VPGESCEGAERLSPAVVPAAFDPVLTGSYPLAGVYRARAEIPAGVAALANHERLFTCLKNA